MSDCKDFALKSGTFLTMLIQHFAQGVSCDIQLHYDGKKTQNQLETSQQFYMD